MAAPESLVQRWLRANVQSYAAAERVFADADAALARFPAVRPKTDVYTYDDGRTQLLLCLHGLLPIAFRGAAYNIPVAVWVTRDYPRQPPIAYVVPTQDMLVKASRHVDPSGKCGIEYLQQWERKSEGCNLSALLEAMQDHFSREPPLYARPRQPASVAPRRSLTPDYSAKPPPPVPPQGPVPAASPANHPDRPVPPPKPGSPAMYAGPAIVQSGGAAPSRAPIQSPVSGHRYGASPPPPPPPPPVSGASQPHGGYGSPLRTSIDARDSLNHGTPPQFGPSQAWSIPPTSGYSSPPPPPPHPPYASPFSGPPPAATSPPPPPTFYKPPPPLPPPHPPQISLAAQGPAPAPAPAPAPVPVPNFLDEDAPASSPPPPAGPMLSDAPARPPNPELLRLHVDVHARLASELASLAQALALDGARLRAHQTDLLAGAPAIRDEGARLDAVRAVCHTSAGRLQTAVRAAEAAVAALRRKGDPEVDELVCSTSIVHNQLINLVAEDNAIEDTIYHLHRALNAGRIDLERFLRTTRVLAEEQFTKRALIEKIQAGLPTGRSMASD